MSGDHNAHQKGVNSTHTHYQPTPEQEKAIRAYLRTSIMPLIEQVLVKKLGQAMVFAAEELEARK